MYKNSIKKLFFLFAAYTLFIGNTVYAGGQEFGDLGTKAMGRGYAFVARADNPSAFYYNPAGLTKSKGLNLLIQANAMLANIDFLRTGGQSNVVEGIPISSPDMDYSPSSTDPYQPVKYETASGKAPFTPQPSLVVSYSGFPGVEGLALAAGIFTPPGVGTPKFSSTGPQRYALREANFFVVYPGVALAYAFNRYFQIGGLFVWGIGSYTQSLAIRLQHDPANTKTYNENATQDADFQFELADNAMPMGIIGVMSQPMDWLELGLTVRTPLKVAPEGKVVYTPSKADFSDSFLKEGYDFFKLTQSYPWMVRFGARYIHERFDIEVDVAWEMWSQFKSEYEIDAIVVEAPDFPREYSFQQKGEFVRDFSDTVSVRIGSDIVVLPKWLTLRLGGYWESSAYPDDHSTMPIDMPFSMNFGVSAGATVHVARFMDIHAGYMHIFQPEVVVKKGIQQQMVPDAELPQDDGSIKKVPIGNYVNNGKYNVDANIFGVSLDMHWL